MAAVGDIASALAYQIKKEIAENYFGGRKALEEEREDLINQMDRLAKAWEQEVLPYLARIYYYLADQEAGKQFLVIIHQEEWLDRLIDIQDNPAVNHIVATCSPGFSLTARGKLNKSVLALYQKAEQKSGPLVETCQTLLKKGRLFNEELADFQGRYNLLDILSFVRTIESTDNLKGVMGENTDPRAVPALEEAMVIHPVDLSRESHPPIHPLPPFSKIKKPIAQLLSITFQDHCSEIEDRLKKG
jgi:hypothetical protein